MPFPPGGSTDALARLVQTGLQQRLGANIIIENKPGASGAAGTAIFAKSAPDGNTWLFVFDTHSVNPYLMNLQYDTEKDLDPVMLVATAPYLLAVNTKHDFKTLADVIAAAKAKPDGLVLRVGRLGLDRPSVHGAAAEEDRREADPRALSRRRSGDERCARRACGLHHRQRRADHAAARQRQAATDRADRREARAAAARRADRRSRAFPISPAYTWWGVFAPAGTPKPIVERFHKELAATIREERVTQAR